MRRLALLSPEGGFFHGLTVEAWSRAHDLPIEPTATDLLVPQLSAGTWRVCDVPDELAGVFQIAGGPIGLIRCASVDVVPFGRSAVTLPRSGPAAS